MKHISRLAFVLRLAGTILICLALVLTAYAWATAAAPWEGMQTQFASVEAQANIRTRADFVTRYFAALKRAVSEKEAGNVGSAARAALIREYFAPCAALYEEARAARAEQTVADIYAYFLTDFDYPAFLAQYEAREDNAERLAIEEIYEYLDSRTASVAPKGKKLPARAASQAEAFLPDFYAALVTERGEDAVGGYLEFLEAVRQMLEGEDTVTSARDYLEKSFDFEAYLTSRQAVAQAEKAERQNDFLANFAAFAQETPTAEALAAHFEGEFAQVLTLAPEADYAVFLAAARDCVAAGAAFDGSYKALTAAMRTLEREAEAAPFATFLDSFSREAVAQADQNAAIGALVALWGLVAVRQWFYLAGLALLVLAVAGKKILMARFLRGQSFAPPAQDEGALLRVTHLKQYFKGDGFVNKAVDDVSFTIQKGEVFGLVGESGCGKTTTGRTIINLYDPTGGDVYFQGLRVSSSLSGMPTALQQLRNDYRAKRKTLRGDAAAIRALKRDFAEKQEEIKRHAYESEEEKRRSQQAYREKRKAELTEAFNREAASLNGAALEARKKRYQDELAALARDNIMTKMQMIFQDPIASINPRMTVREIIAEGLRIRGVKDAKYIDEKVYEMLELVGLVPEHADRYPHEFSGGQRQRIGIARAIVLEPDLIIADEPISALDVSIQAQVINLLNELREKMGLTILFIAHNLSVVKYFSDRIAVMYYGHIVELAASDELFAHPLHPYTKSLLSAIPYPDPHYEKTRKRIEYNPASRELPEGAAMREIVPGHFVLCTEEEGANYLKELNR